MKEIVYNPVFLSIEEIRFKRVMPTYEICFLLKCTNIFINIKKSAWNVRYNDMDRHVEKLPVGCTPFSPGNLLFRRPTASPSKITLNMLGHPGLY